MQIDSTAANGVSSPLDWYNHGVVDILEPMLLGGQAAFSPAFFTAANVTSKTIVEMLPGKFPIHAFGGASSQVTLGRDLHSFTFRLNVSTFCGIRLVHGFPPVY